MRKMGLFFGVLVALIICKNVFAAEPRTILKTDFPSSHKISVHAEFQNIGDPSSSLPLQGAPALLLRRYTA